MTRCRLLAAALLLLPVPLLAQTAEGLDATDLRLVEQADNGITWPDDWALPADYGRGESLIAVVRGMPVVGSLGRPLGEVEGVLAGRDGRARALAVETDGLLDLGDPVVLPLSKASMSTTGDAFVTTLTEQELEALPRWRD
ncbi:hypothetical protein C882_0159 [Caenispirillum salinarum AK4]|uniref:PRC-barrel domain-containing protein n=1 Tax=Caenispirillum salinarum AK4 TaxID=1238182 RepID=K9HI59_9PROT|nr:PRC-barrel domain-containing protein [Caenispirillum salinarum]EKV30078.1 hypothetical protein C882_0159 [Caenispirillum salinarum AK4]